MLVIPTPVQAGQFSLGAHCIAEDRGASYADAEADLSLL